MNHKLVRHVSQPHDIYVGRPSQWGNPYKIDSETDRSTAIRLYRLHLMSDPQMMDAARMQLRGKTLGCHCAPLPCHADILAEVANS